MSTNPPNAVRMPRNISKTRFIGGRPRTVPGCRRPVRDRPDRGHRALVRSPGRDAHGGDEVCGLPQHRQQLGTEGIGLRVRRLDRGEGVADAARTDRRFGHDHRRGGPRQPRQLGHRGGQDRGPGLRCGTLSGRHRLALEILERSGRGDTGAGQGQCDDREHEPSRARSVPGQVVVPTEDVRRSGCSDTPRRPNPCGRCKAERFAHTRCPAWVSTDPRHRRVARGTVPLSRSPRTTAVSRHTEQSGARRSVKRGDQSAQGTPEEGATPEPGDTVTPG